MTSLWIRKTSTFVLSFLTVASIMLPISASGSSSGPRGDDPQLALGITADFGKWTNGIVPWVYNPTGAPVGYQNNVATRDLIESALAEWTGVCNLTFVRSDTDGNSDGIDSTIDIDEFPHDNIVVFQFDAIGGAGLAGPTSSSSTAASLGRWNYFDGTLRLSQAVFNQTGMSADAIERNLLAFDQTVIHEVGHVIGLGHSDEPVSIMYSNPYNALNHIRADDIDNCRNLYGYSSTYTAPELYVAGTAGINNFDSFSLVLASSPFPYTPITSLDDQTDDSLGVKWDATNNGGYSDFLTQVVVDPQGYISTTATTSFLVPGGTIGQFSIASFDLLRELPGTWTVYVYDSTGLLETLPFDVNTSLPAIPNTRPAATLSYTENPATRDVEATVTVTGDADGNNVTIIWHIPIDGITSVPLGASSGSSTKNVSLDNLLNNEVFVEVNDDGVRYNNMSAGFGPAGLGFQNLFRYNSTNRNIGPDHDGDNSSDILWRNMTSGQNWLYEMAGNLPKASKGINTISDQTWQIAGNGDYNGDGKSDILWRNNVTGQNWMYLMNGALIETSAVVVWDTVFTIPTVWQVAGNGDYNGDGRSDILWRNSSTGVNWIYFMNGSVVENSVRVNTVPTDWEVAGNGDYNGDGKSDILWRHTGFGGVGGDGQNWMYLMNGADIDSSVRVNTVPMDWEVAGNGDYNGDGKSDILWRHTGFGGVGGDGRNWMYLMNGAVINSSVSVNTVPTAWRVADNGDYNGDGNADILWRNDTTGQNWEYQMSGSTIINSVGINTVSGAQWQIVNKN